MDFSVWAQSDVIAAMQPQDDKWPLPPKMWPELSYYHIADWLMFQISPDEKSLKTQAL